MAQRLSLPDPHRSVRLNPGSHRLVSGSRPDQALLVASLNEEPRVYEEVGLSGACRPRTKTKNARRVPSWQRPTIRRPTVGHRKTHSTDSGCGAIDSWTGQGLRNRLYSDYISPTCRSVWTPLPTRLDLVRGRRSSGHSSTSSGPRPQAHSSIDPPSPPNLPRRTRIRRSSSPASRPFGDSRMGAGSMAGTANP